jgi:transcriptional regulator with XRE-family HTH domain
MTLEEWKTAHGLGDKEIAEMVGLHQASISRLRRGKRFPSAELMRDFARVTVGAVMPNDWAGCGYRPPASGSPEKLRSR